MFRVQHTDPWVRGDAHRTSRTTTIQVSASASQCRQCALSHTTHHRRPSEHHGRPFADADNSVLLLLQNDKTSAANIHGRALDDVEVAEGTATG
jgi:hypothetical protein